MKSASGLEKSRQASPRHFLIDCNEPLTLSNLSQDLCAGLSVLADRKSA
jgi:hypothetical protein